MYRRAGRVGVLFLVLILSVSFGTSTVVAGTAALTLDQHPAIITSTQMNGERATG